VEDGSVYLRATKDELKAMDAATPPAIREG
jgi:hypothetical protein